MKRRRFLKLMGLGVPVALAGATTIAVKSAADVQDTGITEKTLAYVNRIRITGKLHMTQVREVNKIYAILWREEPLQIIDVTVNGEPWSDDADHVRARELFRDLHGPEEEAPEREFVRADTKKRKKAKR